MCIKTDPAAAARRKKSKHTQAKREMKLSTPAKVDRFAKTALIFSFEIPYSQNHTQTSKKKEGGKFHWGMEACDEQLLTAHTHTHHIDTTQTKRLTIPKHTCP
jgi:hypothetical protein